MDMITVNERAKALDELPNMLLAYAICDVAMSVGRSANYSLWTQFDDKPEPEAAFGDQTEDRNRLIVEFAACLHVLALRIQKSLGNTDPDYAILQDLAASGRLGDEASPQHIAKHILQAARKRRLIVNKQSSEFDPASLRETINFNPLSFGPN